MYLRAVAIACVAYCYVLCTAQFFGGDSGHDAGGIPNGYVGFSDVGHDDMPMGLGSYAHGIGGSVADFTGRGGRAAMWGGDQERATRTEDGAPRWRSRD